MQTAPETSSGLRPTVYSKFSPMTYEGIYHSSSINKPIEEVYAFCQRKENVERVLVDLPEDIKNFLDLEFVSADSISESHRIVWRNKKTSELQGDLTITLSPAPANRGTFIIANAVFGDYDMDSDGPSDLINIFLKRMKALAETGELATTKGQPNGKDEEEIIKH